MHSPIYEYIANIEEQNQTNEMRDNEKDHCVTNEVMEKVEDLNLTIFFIFSLACIIALGNKPHSAGNWLFSKT